MRNGSFENILQSTGCRYSGEDADVAIRMIFEAMFPVWSEDELLVHLDDSKRYADVVCHRLGIQSVDRNHTVVLRRLINQRKTGRFHGSS